MFVPSSFLRCNVNNQCLNDSCLFEDTNTCLIMKCTMTVPRWVVRYCLSHHHPAVFSAQTASLTAELEYI